MRLYATLSALPAGTSPPARLAGELEERDAHDTADEPGQDDPPNLMVRVISPGRCGRHHETGDHVRDPVHDELEREHPPAREQLVLAPSAGEPYGQRYDERGQ